MRIYIAIAVGLLICGSSQDARAQTSAAASQVVVLEVKPVTRIALSGNPGALVITDGQAGNDHLLSVSDNSTAMSITTNRENMKVVASIDEQMPAGTRLLIALEGGKGTGAGTVDISQATMPVDLIVGIGKGFETNRSIQYTFAASASVGQVASQSRVVTLTLTD